MICIFRKNLTISNSLQENFRSLLRVNRYICVPCSKIASEYIVRNFLWRQRLLGYFLRTFSEHAHSQTFLEPTCLTGLSSSFSNFTVSIGRARIFNVSCNENSKILIKCVISPPNTKLSFHLWELTLRMNYM